MRKHGTFTVLKLFLSLMFMFGQGYPQPSARALNVTPFTLHENVAENSIRAYLSERLFRYRAEGFALDGAELSLEHFPPQKLHDMRIRVLNIRRIGPANYEILVSNNGKDFLSSLDVVSGEITVKKDLGPRFFPSDGLSSDVMPADISEIVVKFTRGHGDDELDVNDTEKLYGYVREAYGEDDEAVMKYFTEKLPLSSDAEKSRFASIMHALGEGLYSRRNSAGRRAFLRKSSFFLDLACKLTGNFACRYSLAQALSHIENEEETARMEALDLLQNARDDFEREKALMLLGYIDLNEARRAIRKTEPGDPDITTGQYKLLEIKATLENILRQRRLHKPRGLSLFGAAEHLSARIGVLLFRQDAFSFGTDKDQAVFAAEDILRSLGRSLFWLNIAFKKAKPGGERKHAENMMADYAAETCLLISGFVEDLPDVIFENQVMQDRFIEVENLLENVMADMPQGKRDMIANISSVRAGIREKLVPVLEKRVLDALDGHFQARMKALIADLQWPDAADWSVPGVVEERFDVILDGLNIQEFVVSCFSGVSGAMRDNITSGIQGNRKARTLAWKMQLFICNEIIKDKVDLAIIRAFNTLSPEDIRPEDIHKKVRSLLPLEPVQPEVLRGKIDFLAEVMNVRVLEDHACMFSMDEFDNILGTEGTHPIIKRSDAYSVVSYLQDPLWTRRAVAILRIEDLFNAGEVKGERRYKIIGELESVAENDISWKVRYLAVKLLSRHKIDAYGDEFAVYEKINGHEITSLKQHKGQLQKAFHILQRGLADPDPGIRENAVLLLGWLRNEHVYDQLTEVVAEDNDPGVRVAASRSLGILRPFSDDDLRKKTHKGARSLAARGAELKSRLEKVSPWKSHVSGEEITGLEKMSDDFDKDRGDFIGRLEAFLADKSSKSRDLRALLTGAYLLLEKDLSVMENAVGLIEESISGFILKEKVKIEDRMRAARDFSAESSVKTEWVKELFDSVDILCKRLGDLADLSAEGFSEKDEYLSFSRFQSYLKKANDDAGKSENLLMLLAVETPAQGYRKVFSDIDEILVLCADIGGFFESRFVLRSYVQDVKDFRSRMQEYLFLEMEFPEIAGLPEGRGDVRFAGVLSEQKWFLEQIKEALETTYSELRQEIKDLHLSILDDNEKDDVEELYHVFLREELTVPPVGIGDSGWIGSGGVSFDRSLFEAYLSFFKLKSRVVCRYGTARLKFRETEELMSRSEVKSPGREEEYSALSGEMAALEEQIFSAFLPGIAARRPFGEEYIEDKDIRELIDQFDREVSSADEKIGALWNGLLSDYDIKVKTEISVLYDVLSDWLDSHDRKGSSVSDGLLGFIQRKGVEPFRKAFSEGRDNAHLIKLLHESISLMRRWVSKLFKENAKVVVEVRDKSAKIVFGDALVDELRKKTGNDGMFGDERLMLRIVECYDPNCIVDDLSVYVLGVEEPYDIIRLSLKGEDGPFSIRLDPSGGDLPEYPELSKLGEHIHSGVSLLQELGRGDEAEGQPVLSPMYFPIVMMAFFDVYYALLERGPLRAILDGLDPDLGEVSVACLKELFSENNYVPEIPDDYKAAKDHIEADPGAEGYEEKAEFLNRAIDESVFREKIIRMHPDVEEHRMAFFRAFLSAVERKTGREYVYPEDVFSPGRIIPTLSEDRGDNYMDMFGLYAPDEKYAGVYFDPLSMKFDHRGFGAGDRAETLANTLNRAFEAYVHDLFPKGDSPWGRSDMPDNADPHHAAFRDLTEGLSLQGPINIYVAGGLPANSLITGNSMMLDKDFVEFLMENIYGEGDYEKLLREEVLKRKFYRPQVLGLSAERLFFAGGSAELALTVLAERVFHELGHVSMRGQGFSRMDEEVEQLERDVLFYAQIYSSDPVKAELMDAFVHMKARGAEKGFSKAFNSARLFGHIREWSQTILDSPEKTRESIRDFVESALGDVYMTPRSARLFPAVPGHKPSPMRRLILLAEKFMRIDNSVMDSLAGKETEFLTGRRRMIISSSLVPGCQSGLIRKINKRSRESFRSGWTGDLIEIRDFSYIQNVRSEKNTDIVLLLEKFESELYRGDQKRLVFERTGDSPVEINGLVSAGRALLYGRIETLREVLSLLSGTDISDLPDASELVKVLDEGDMKRFARMTSIILPGFKLVGEEVNVFNETVLKFVQYA
jgi:hypothetical protein